MSKTEAKGWSQTHKPEGVSDTDWCHYLWQVAGQTTEIRAAKAREFGYPQVPDNVLALA